MSTTEATEQPSPGEAQQPAGGPAGPPATPTHFDTETPEGQLGLAFKRAMAAVRRLRGRESQRLGKLSFAQYGLLFGLSDNCLRSARELADHAELSPATVTQMLESLEAAGLVRRTRSEQDRRVVLTELTERGAAIVAERHAQMEPRWRAAIAGLSVEELRAGARVLGVIADYFDGLLEESDGQEAPAAAAVEDQPR